MTTLRNCLLPPIPELFDAAKLLHQAALAHKNEDRKTAASLIAQTDANPSLMDSPIFDWSETLFRGNTLSMGKRIDPSFKASIFYITEDPQKPHTCPPEQQDSEYIPAALRKAVIERDRYFCRYCGIPVINQRTKSIFRKYYQEDFRWGTKNRDKHVVFQALDLHYDHVIPRSCGGRTRSENLIVACASCNCGKENHTLAEMRLSDPRDRPPSVPAGFEDWDGLSLIFK